MLRKLIYLSFIFGLTACGSGMSDMEACSKNSVKAMYDDFTKKGMPTDQKQFEEAMSMSWEEMQKEEEWKLIISVCENLKATDPDEFKKAVKGEF